MFAFLCRLEQFDLSGNLRLDQNTLAGYLACTMKNLKDATRSDACNKGLKGDGSVPVLSTSYPYVLTYVFGVSGEILVALLRWKFVENRTVKLEGNSGLMLPSNICELGDSVTKIDLSFHNLRGELSIRSERLHSF